MKVKAFFSVGLVLLGGICTAPLMADQWMNVDIPLSMIVASNSCTGQDIAFQGSTHISWNVTTNKSSMHIQLHINAQGVGGIGLTDGARYVLLEGEDFNTNVNGAAPVELQTNMDFGLIGQGQAPNSRVRVVTHTTVDATGKVSVEFVKGSIVCQP